MEKEVVSNANSEVSDQRDVVKYETHAKLLGQHKKVQEQLAEMQSKLNEFTSLEEQRKNEELEQQGEFKKLLELREQKIAELTENLTSHNSKIEEMQQREANTWKLQAFYNKLPGRIKDSAYLTHVNLDNIVYDSENMSCDEQSVEKVVNDFMEKHSHLVDPINKAKLPTQAPVNSLEVKTVNKDVNSQLTDVLTKAFTGS